MAPIALLKFGIETVPAGDDPPAVVGTALADPLRLPPRMRFGGRVIVGDLLAGLDVAPCDRRLIPTPPGVGITAVIHVLTAVKGENKSVPPTPVSEMPLFYRPLAQLLAGEFDIVGARRPKDRPCGNERDGNETGTVDGAVVGLEEELSMRIS